MNDCWWMDIGRTDLVVTFCHWVLTDHQDWCQPPMEVMWLWMLIEMMSMGMEMMSVRMFVLLVLMMKL